MCPKILEAERIYTSHLDPSSVPSLFADVYVIFHMRVTVQLSLLMVINPGLARLPVAAGHQASSELRCGVIVA